MDQNDHLLNPSAKVLIKFLFANFLIIFLKIFLIAFFNGAEEQPFLRLWVRESQTFCH